MYRNRIIERIMLKVYLELDSDLCVSSGCNGTADYKVQKDYNGIPYIPASSIAGAFRTVLEERQGKELLGYIEEGGGIISPLFISDISFESRPIKTKIRNSICLDRYKQAVPQKKYSTEVIGRGHRAVLRMELVIRQQNDRTLLLGSLYKVLMELEEGYVRIGMKQSRGNGKLRINKIERSTFTEDNAEKWLDFNWNRMQEETTLNQLASWKAGEDGKERYLNIEVPLILSAGISIHPYAVDKNKTNSAEFKIQASERETIPVIPGTTWSGAIRHKTRELLEELGATAVVRKEILDLIFGYVWKNKNGQVAAAKKSLIIVEESQLLQAVPKEIIRNQINRFDASVKEGALYQERIYYGGNTYLRIHIENTEDAQWIMGMLYLVLKELEYGHLAIGRRTAVGRGIFQFDPRRVFCYPRQKEYLACLKQKVGVWE